MEDEICEILRNDDVSALEGICLSSMDVDDVCPRPKHCENMELFNSSPSLLCAACYFRSYECVKTLLALLADVDYTDDMGRKPILFAVVGGSLQVIQLLLENGASLDTVDNAGNGIVHYIVTYRKKPLLLWFALTNGLSLSPRNNRKVTPLHLAATAQMTDFVKLLCENGAEVDAQTDRGATPLHYASSKTCLEIIEILHQFGANLSMKDNGVRFLFMVFLLLSFASISLGWNDESQRYSTISCRTRCGC